MKKIVLAIALAAAAAASQAQVYVQGNLGSARASANGLTKSNSTLGLALGYQINANFAVDAIYQGLYKDSPEKTTAIFVRAIGIYPVSDTFSINGKIGAGQTKITDGTDSATGNMTFGIGFDFALNKQTTLGLDIDSYKNKETAVWPSVKQTNAAVTIKYKF